MGTELTKSWKTMLLVLNRPEPARVTGSKPLYLGTWSKAATPPCGSAPAKDMIMVLCPRRQSGFGQIVHLWILLCMLDLIKPVAGSTPLLPHVFQLLKSVCCSTHWHLFPRLEIRTTNQSFVGGITNGEVTSLRQGRKIATGTFWQEMLTSADEISAAVEVVVSGQKLKFDSTWQMKFSVHVKH